MLDCTVFVVFMAVVDRLVTNVRYGRRTILVDLRLRDDEAGDALTLLHLTTELHRLTGVPMGRQSLVVDGWYRPR